MKRAETAAGFSIFVIVLLFFTPFAALVVSGDEGALIQEVIIREGAGMRNIQVRDVKSGDGWALAGFDYDDVSRRTRGASALLKKSGETWQLVQFSGKTPTTDLLRQNNVPPGYRGNLIDAASVSKTRPALAYLHSIFPRQSFESIEISGKYALARWYGGEESGMTLMRQSGNTWKILLSTGGEIDRSAMRHYAVSDEHIKELLGIK